MVKASRHHLARSAVETPAWRSRSRRGRRQPRTCDHAVHPTCEEFPPVADIRIFASRGVLAGPAVGVQNGQTVARIRLAYTSVFFGGRRPWFLCPACDQRDADPGDRAGRSRHGGTEVVAVNERRVGNPWPLLLSRKRIATGFVDRRNGREPRIVGRVYRERTSLEYPPPPPSSEQPGSSLCSPLQ